ncbi:MAG: hypothetical protein WBP39_12125, partial [Candidatus Phosphoribacter baldrii]
MRTGWLVRVLVRVLVVVGAMRGVPVTVVDVVDMIAMGDRFVATPGAMFVPVALGLVVARASRAGQP